MSVLDASALLAFLFREPGGEAIRDVVDAACISTVNLSEVLGRFARDGHDPAAARSRLLSTSLQAVTFTEDHAVRAASLLPHTRELGLSLGDRACLALGLERGEPIYTADRTWKRLAVGVEIITVREHGSALQALPGVA